MRTIKVCPGIGDNIWLFQKLINSGEQFNFQMTSAHPQRGKQIFDLVPAVSASCTYTDGMESYKYIKQHAERGNFAHIEKDTFFLECNTHLEQGRRIEKYLPDLKTSYTLDYTTTRNDNQKAIDILGVFRHNVDKQFIGIYGSSYSSARRWNFWQENEWFELCLMLRSSGAVFVIIGADWDLDLAGKLIPKLELADIPYVNTVGQPLSVVIEIMKKLSYFFGFPSGLSILNETLQKPGMMFYPPHLKYMIGTWADPKRVGFEFKECEFCTPQTAYAWWKANFKM